MNAEDIAMGRAIAKVGSKVILKMKYNMLATIKNTDSPTKKSLSSFDNIDIGNSKNNKNLSPKVS